MDQKIFDPSDIILKDGKNLTLRYKDLTHAVIGAAFEVYNTLGYGYLEKIYENALVHELNERGIANETQHEFVVQYKDAEVGRYVADLIADGKVIVEIKSVDKLVKAHEAQLLNYLKGTGLEVGLLLNFARTEVEYKRLVF